MMRINQDTDLIVLDGANIGWAAGQNHCSGQGLLSAINYCRERGFTPVVFLPNHYLSNKDTKRLIKDHEQLSPQIELGTIIPVPPRDDDDLYMLTFAQQKNAKLISNDLYRDYIKSSENESAQEWVSSNVISYTFVLHEFFPNPKFIDFFDSKGKSSDKDSVENDAIPELEDEVKIQSENEKSNEIISINDTPIVKVVEDTLNKMSKKDDLEKKIGFKYLCLVCGEGFRKWSKAHDHKKKTGHGAHICTECDTILPSPKSAKEHQAATGHDGLKGTWIGQHEMAVKNIKQLNNLSIQEFIQKRNNSSSTNTSDADLQIHGFNVSKKGLHRGDWPESPEVAAKIIIHFEKINPDKLSWAEAQIRIARELDIPKIRTKGVLRAIHSISEMKSNFSRKGIINWKKIEISGGMFEEIRIFVTKHVWGNQKPAKEWQDGLISYFDIVKIKLALDN